MIELPEARLTVSLILPLPLAVKPLAPVVPVAVKVSLAIADGKTSDTLPATTLPGPLLVTVIV